MADEVEKKQWLRQFEWVELPVELRQKLRVVYNIPKSEQTVVRSGVKSDVLVSDGVTQADLMAFNLSALQASLGVSKGDFDELFAQALDLVNARSLDDLTAERAAAGKEGLVLLVGSPEPKATTIRHLLTRADMDLNPVFEKEGLKVGDEIEIPTSNDAKADALMNNLNATPEELNAPATPEQIASADKAEKELAASSLLKPKKGRKPKAKK